MANIIIENYIADNYSKWLRRAKRLCSLYGVRASDAEDILQDVMLAIFKSKGEKEIREMITIRIYDTYSLLEIFISRAMRYKLANYKKTTRSRNRITISGLDITRINVADDECIPRYDVYEQQQRLARIIPQLPVNDKVKYTLHWKLVDNQLLDTARGDRCDVTQRYKIGLESLKQAITTQSHTY